MIQKLRMPSHLAQLSRTMSNYECPLFLFLTALHSRCSSLTMPEFPWVTWSMECDLYFYLHFLCLGIKFLNCSLVSAILKTVTDFFHCFICCCLNLKWILHKQSQWCRRSMPVLVHMHPYRAKAHLLQPCQGRQSVPCLGTERSAHTSQTNWTLGVKYA